MKKTILSLLVALMTTTGARAQSPTTSGIIWDATTTSGTFSMPAYDVEVNTELWYKLKQDGTTPVDNKTKANVFLERTLSNSTWSTFCAPFNIGNSAAEDGHHFDGTSLEGATVKELSSTSFSAGTLYLNFTNATSIVAGTPYLVKADVEDPTFEGVTQDWTTTHEVTPAANGGYVTFVPVLTPTTLDANDRTKLYLSTNNTLYYPSQSMTIKGFRAYFQLNNDLTAGEPSSSGSARSFVLNLGDGEQTGVTDNKRETINNNRWFTVDGVRVEGQPTRKGVYIKNGRKVVIK